MRIYNQFIKIYMIMMILLVNVFGQNRGNRLGFQGINLANKGVVSNAMGQAFTAIQGDVEALFFNPAGLIGIEGINFSISANSFNKTWFERQDYRPNRQLVTASFILDGLYTPPDSTNGMLDYEAFLQDTAGNYYIVNDPELGKNPHEEKNADWVKELNRAGFNSATLAVPFSLFDKRFVVSGSYYINNVYDYDRNETYLDPHFTDDKYNAPERVTQQGDSVRINWYNYERFREGPTATINFTIAFELNEYLKFGLGYERLSGTVDDFQQLNKVGYFDIIDNYNTYKFSYDTALVALDGTSNFNSSKFNLGLLFNYNNISVGANVVPAYKIKREWNYNKTVPDSSDQSISGIDNMEIPLSLSLGVSIKPIDNLILAVDYHSNPYGSADITNNNNPYNIPADYVMLEDTTENKWEDMNYFSFGLKYNPWKKVAIMAGYKGIPSVFIPDGNAIKERGPVTESYSLGMSVDIFYGSLQFGYEYRKLKYYDIYFSNTNYCTEIYDNISIGYNVEF